jgi:chromosomal replication initiator protein
MFEQTWLDLREDLRNSLSVNEFDAWIKPIEFVSADTETLTVSVPTAYNLVWLEDNYLVRMSEGLNTLAGKIVRLNVLVAPKKPAPENAAPEEAVSGITINEKPDPFIRDHALFPNYTFNRFIVGDNNSLANAAALKVANSPGSAYNPLFLYGGVGLGKTHLMHAVGNALLQKNVNYKIAYITSEEFMNLFVESIQKKRPEQFRKRFRSLDVLLLDDVQFLLRAPETKQELFNTFNALHSKKKQIIITSDRTPKQLQVDGLDDRLASRVGSGLDVEIRKPSFETRKAILMAKASEEKVLIPNTVYSMIAESIETDIRLLENALNRVIAEHKLLNQEITVDMAMRTLKLLIAEWSPRNVSFEDILRETSNVFKLSKVEIKSKSRTTQINHARQIVMLLARRLTQMSWSEIADELVREHPTIISGTKRMEAELDKNQRLKEKYDEIIRNLKLGSAIPR